jgi:hypothetical protein
MKIDDDMGRSRLVDTALCHTHRRPSISQPLPSATGHKSQSTCRCSSLDHNPTAMRKLLLVWHALFVVVICVCDRAVFVRASSLGNCPTRGGEKLQDSASWASTLKRFLSDDSRRSSDGHEKRFYIQGWRWHNMALIREARKLQQLAETASTTTTSAGPSSPAFGLAVQRSADYIVNFNMKGLHKIEKDLFFPWARSKVGEVKDTGVAAAFASCMDHLEHAQTGLGSMGDSLLVSGQYPRKSSMSCSSLDFTESCLFSYPFRLQWKHLCPRTITVVRR